MDRLVTKLKNGVVYELLDSEFKFLLLEMEEAGIVYKKEVNEERIYRFCNNVDIEKNNGIYYFTIKPNRYIGVFFDYDEVFECVSEDKKEPKNYCTVFALNPKEETVQYFGVGNELKLKVEARGYDFNNEGLLLKLPRGEEEFYEMTTSPCLTIGLAEGAKGKNTSSLNFEERISGKFIKGRKGICIEDKVYFNLKDIKSTATVYSLRSEIDGLIMKKEQEKKMFNR